jgi:serine/threonine protein kinase
MIKARPLSEDLSRFIGRRLNDKYLLNERIGGGGFGTVFLSDQFFLEVPTRRVAVKISKATGFTAAKAREIFADVFMLAKAMDEMNNSQGRSNLVHIYDAGILHEENDRIFVVMEYIDGQSLRQKFIPGCKLDSGLLLDLVRQICRALEGLHMLSPPVIHRDLKPENILIGLDDVVRVIDFGLAARLTNAGYVLGTVGTVAYMAPETTMGFSVPASDVYSIGVLLYEGLTGKLPYYFLKPPSDLPVELHSDWLYKQKSLIQPAPPSSLNNTVSPQLDKIVMSCLKFDHNARFFNANKLLQAINDLDKHQAPDEVAFEEGRLKKGMKDLRGACERFEYGLALPSSSNKVRYNLLYELGEALKMSGNYSASVNRLVEAWEFARFRAVLETRKERFDLLDEIVKVYKTLSNDFQARRYEMLRAKEM